jgi:hypothetical protein
MKWWDREWAESGGRENGLSRRVDESEERGRGRAIERWRWFTNAET